MNIMKKHTLLLKSLVLTTALLTTQSCKEQLQEINTNPNQLNESRPEYLFTNATIDFNLAGRAPLIARYGGVMTYMQYVVADGASREGLEGTYANPTQTQSPSPGLNYYSDYYSSTGRDLNRIISLIDGLPADQKQTYTAVRAIVKILDTFQAWRVSDIYGAMPYSQAFQNDKYPLPAYDYNWDLYKVFDQQLKESATILKAPPAGQVSLGQQDFFYQGDVAKWMKFANTLRIRIAQRYENRDAANLTAVLADIATNFNGQIISSNAESFGYSNLRDWNNNLDDINALLLQYTAAFPFVEFLKSTKDPRIGFMLRENDFGTNYKRYRDVKANATAETQAFLNAPDASVRYWGKHVFPASVDAAYGLLGSSRVVTLALKTGPSQTLNFLSNIQTRLFLKNGGFKTTGDAGVHDDETVVDGSTIKIRTPFLTYADAALMMAEIAAKGGNGLGKSAEIWYNDGVTASFNFYKDFAVATGVPNAATTTFGDYLTRYPYKGLPSIYSQAWVNFLTVPEESWAMWKRTGYPQFVDFRAGQPSKIGDGSGIAYMENLWNGSLNLLIPRRMALPTPQPQNQDNFNKAVEAQKAKDPAYGVSNVDTKGRIWWDNK